MDHYIMLTRAFIPPTTPTPVRFLSLPSIPYPPSILSSMLPYSSVPPSLLTVTGEEWPPRRAATPVEYWPSRCRYKLCDDEGVFIGRGRGHGMWAELMGWVEQGVLMMLGREAAPLKGGELLTLAICTRAGTVIIFLMWVYCIYLDGFFGWKGAYLSIIRRK